MCRLCEYVGERSKGWKWEGTGGVAAERGTDREEKVRDRKKRYREERGRENAIF